MVKSRAATLDVTAMPAGNRLAVGYGRVSSKEQEEEGFSLDSQARLYRAYAAEHGLTLADTFQDVETAKEAGRRDFNRMLDYLRANRNVRVVLVEKTDRLYRNFKDWVSVDELGLEIHFIKENCVVSPESRSHEKFMHGIKVLMAKNYIDNLSEEVRKGQKEKAEQGGWPSCAPLGYLNVLGQDGKRAIIPDLERAPLVAKLYEWYATGDRSLKDVGVMARDAGLNFRKSHTPVNTAEVHRILRQRLYSGDFVWGGKVYRGVHEPIISRELWEQVQEVMDGRFIRRPKRRKHRFAFGGLIRCGHCGCALTGDVKKGRYVYYRCSGYKGRCPDPYVREEVLTEQFASLLDGLALEPEVLDWITQALRESLMDEKKFHDDAIARLDGEFAVIQKRLETMYIDKLDGRVNDNFYDRMAAEWRAEQDRIMRALEGHGTADRSYLDEGVRLLELGGRAAELFQTQEPEARRELLGHVLSDSTWRAGALTATFRPPFDVLLSEVGKARTAELSSSKVGSGSSHRRSALSNSPRSASRNSNRPSEGRSAADFENWREGRDSNPRGSFTPPTRLAGGCFRPLSHLPARWVILAFGEQVPNGFDPLEEDLAGVDGGLPGGGDEAVQGGGGEGFVEVFDAAGLEAMGGFGDLEDAAAGSPRIDRVHQLGGFTGGVGWGDRGRQREPPPVASPRRVMVPGNRQGCGRRR